MIIRLIHFSQSERAQDHDHIKSTIVYVFVLVVALLMYVAEVFQFLTILKISRATLFDLSTYQTVSSLAFPLSH